MWIAKLVVKYIWSVYENVTYWMNVAFKIREEREPYFYSFVVTLEQDFIIGKTVVIQEKTWGNIEADEDINGIVLVWAEYKEKSEDVQDPAGCMQPVHWKRGIYGNKWSTNWVLGWVCWVEFARTYIHWWNEWSEWAIQCGPRTCSPHRCGHHSRTGRHLLECPRRHRFGWSSRRSAATCIGYECLARTAMLWALLLSVGKIWSLPNYTCDEIWSFWNKNSWIIYILKS
jgi:hypothetical protein